MNKDKPTTIEEWMNHPDRKKEADALAAKLSAAQSKFFEEVFAAPLKRMNENKK